MVRNLSLLRGPGLLPGWAFPGVDQALGDVSQFDVEMLGRPAQDVEGLVGRDPFAFHQNTLGLPDQVPANQGGLQVGDPGVFGLTGFGGGQRQAGQDGKHHSFGAVGGPERPRVGGVAVDAPGASPAAKCTDSELRTPDSTAARANSGHGLSSARSSA